MSLAFLLRRSATPNRFRSVIHAALNARVGDAALICSGYFQERWGYSANNDGHPAHLGALLATSNTAATTVGVRDNTWVPDYRVFCQGLIAAGASVTPYVGTPWHAKVFVLSRGQEGLLAVVGSSNMTRPAYGVSSPFNFEADVVIWRARIPALNQAVWAALDASRENGHEVVIGRYVTADNFGLSVQERIERLRDDILREATT